MNYSPFEQFEVNVLLKFKLFGLDLSLTNLLSFLILAHVILVFFFTAVDKNKKFVPSNWQSVLETIYLFVVGLVREQSGKKGIKFFPFFFTVFTLILIMNTMGLLPFSFTVTSHIIVTISIALSFVFCWIIIGFMTLGLKFFLIFVPKGIPMWLLPMLVLIEVLSYILRPLSLAIRLFANMLAGHILLHIIAASAVFLSSQWFLLVLLPVVFVILIFFLEIFISFLQAYIFTILLAIYLRDSLYGH
eukprot:TRINITY_DN235_c0_g1_i10.p1 TRINITY_DN235_c0_g1~~TRINITY_DN235_c0_g1_i10.p1  ORF type:complete len:246 (+),score=-32.29 TRINITY_DN235_c0_g1_i10:1630-2367(+)